MHVACGFNRFEEATRRTQKIGEGFRNFKILFKSIVLDTWVVVRVGVSITKKLCT